VSEFAPPARRGFYAALPFAGCIVGILLANGIFTLVQRLPKDEFLSYGWCIPFLFSAVVIVVGIVIRMRVKESPVFEEIKRTGHASKRPVRDLMSEARGTLLVAFCLRVGENGSSYLYQVFALSYLTKVLLVDKSIGTIGLTITAALAVFTTEASVCRASLRRGTLPPTLIGRSRNARARLCGDDPTRLHHAIVHTLTV
jgi:MFS family permease